MNQLHLDAVDTASLRAYRVEDEATIDVPGFYDEGEVDTEIGEEEVRVGTGGLRCGIRGSRSIGG